MYNTSVFKKSLNEWRSYYSPIKVLLTAEILRQVPEFNSTNVSPESAWCPFFLIKVRHFEMKVFKTCDISLSIEW